MSGDDPALDILNPAAQVRIASLDAFPAVVVRLMDGWAPHAEDGAAMTRTLRDLGQYMAGLCAVQLYASPEGLTHASLTRLVSRFGVAGRTRVTALLAYLQFIGMLRRLPEADNDARSKAYGPTPALMTLFRNRFQRELTHVLAVIPEAHDALALWDRPGVVETFVASQARITMSGFQNVDPAQQNLTVFSSRNAGLTLLGQIVVAACPDGRFPPRGPVQLNISDLARRSGVSRAHARGILKAAAGAGLLTEAGDGGTLLTAGLVRNIVQLTSSYILSLAWSARQAVDWTVAQTPGSPPSFGGTAARPG